MKLKHNWILSKLLFLWIGFLGIQLQAVAAEKWPEITFPTSIGNLNVADQNALLAESLLVDLQDYGNSMVVHATLALDASKFQKNQLSFYLNPGLEIVKLKNQDGQSLHFSKQGALIQIPSLKQSNTDEAITYVCMKYKGRLVSNPIFKNSKPPLLDKEQTLVLTHESSWFPWMPGQRFSGQMRVLTPPGVNAWSCSEEKEMIEIRGVRQTEFQWDRRINRLVLAASPLTPVRVKRENLILEMAIPEEFKMETSLFYTLILHKIDFFGRAYYPLHWKRLNLIGLSSGEKQAHGAGILTFPGEELAFNMAGDPLPDRMIACLWFRELLQFSPEEESIELGFVEFAARLFGEELLPTYSKQLWIEEGLWISRLDQPKITSKIRIPWLLHMIHNRIGRERFFELNQEFLQRNLDQVVTFKDYLDLSEEIFRKDPVGRGLSQFAEPWLNQDKIPRLQYRVEFIEAPSAQLLLHVEQEEENLWQFEIEAELFPVEDAPLNKKRIETIHIKKQKETFQFNLPSVDWEIELDPEWKILVKKTRVFKH